VALPPGAALALAAGLVSGVAILVAGYGVREFASPSLYSALRNTFVALLLLALLARPGALTEIRRLSRAQLAGLAALGIVGGSLPFALFFEGLSQVGPGTAAFIQKSLFLWVAALAVIFLRERLSGWQVGALGLLVVAQFLIGWPPILASGIGELLILLATLIWSIEVVLAKRLLASVSSGLAATARMAIGAVALMSYLGVTGQLAPIPHLSLVQWAWVVGPGLLLFAYISLWYAALQRAPATTATGILTIGAPITALLSAAGGRDLPRPEELLGYGMLMLAVLVFALQRWRRDSNELRPSAWLPRMRA
jgi:drug/metabolite transporter (DMT)-like permease